MTRTSYKKKLPIIVALDASWREVNIWTKRLEGLVWGFKVGSILFSEKGPKVIEAIQKSGFKVFLDLKYHDIPNTVQLSVRRAFSWGVDCLTVHASGGRAMLEAAASEQKRNQDVIAVTVLTSLDHRDLKSLGISRGVRPQVLSLSEMAVGAGIRGLVCSPREVRELRHSFPSSRLITPGVRLGGSTQDQKRTETLAKTLNDGADLAVVGRALTGADDWKQAWQILSSSTGEMSSKKR